ncbi:hypothetical protein C1I97_29700 [Streptomyces sp. NTH33]|nr:hypothetical protein C1I97_29700 [Streptomyces sp. NTH33]
MERVADGVPVVTKVWRELTERAAGLGLVPPVPAPSVRRTAARRRLWEGDGRRRAPADRGAERRGRTLLA